MNPELNVSLEKVRRVPEVLLKEGPDFFDIEDLYARIAEEVAKLERNPADTVLCGHVDTGEGDESRSRTFAMPFDEIPGIIEYHVGWTPFEYAEDASFSTGKAPVISVYDAKLVERVEEEADIFKTVDGSPLQKALILRINIALQ